MKMLWLLIVLLSGTLMYAWQGTTPQAALEEIATTTKPEVLARHLPEPVQKRIEDLPQVEKQQVLEKLLEIKSDHLDGCTVRPAQGSEGWEIIDGDGNSKGKVKVANAFFSGTQALLPLELELETGAQSFIVTMHLEGDEWRIDNLGPWEKDDLGLEELLHQPTQIEQNDEAAYNTLVEIVAALRQYGYKNLRSGFPSELNVLTEASNGENAYLDKSYAADPLIKDGYQFRYLRTAFAGDAEGIGEFEVTATPLEFGKTGSKNYLVTFYQTHVTTENRPATKEDPSVGGKDRQVIVLD
ncbi:MAG TPA: hypothetical protein VIB39_00355 [Candidatus Angelobacter sp.]|jgi:hypothetical protein